MVVGDEVFAARIAVGKVLSAAEDWSCLRWGEGWSWCFLMILGGGNTRRLNLEFLKKFLATFWIFIQFLAPADGGCWPQVPSLIRR